MNELEDPIHQIVDAVAEAEGVESATLDPPLATVVDPDALETLFEDTSASALEVQFTYRGHDVVVQDGGVRVN